MNVRNLRSDNEKGTVATTAEHVPSASPPLTQANAQAFSTYTSGIGGPRCGGSCTHPAVAPTVDGVKTPVEERSGEQRTMTVSIRRMTLGSGYKYLMGSVAQSDGASQHESALTRCYAESGTPPGRFIGQGLAGLGYGLGIEPGTQVTEEHLFRMLGMVQDPLTGEQLGRPPCAQKAPYAERVRTRVDERLHAPQTHRQSERGSRQVVAAIRAARRR